MNYYEHHLGDYVRDTAHLSMLEDAAYRRLLDAYYIREAPLPTDVRDCCKLARAQSKPEREAVAYVLREFFELRDDGHHQDRCDREIARYLEKLPEIDRKRENAAERQRRARDHRKDLFEQLRQAGEVPHYSTPTHDLVTLLETVKSRNMSRVTSAQRNATITRNDTATHTPDTIHQTPNTLTPANAGVSAETAYPPCPHGDVIELFAKHFPELPQPRRDLWAGARADHLRSRWRWLFASGKVKNSAEGLAWFERFFGYAAKSDFLTGRNGKWTGCDLGWMVEAKNFAKIIEGKYHEEERVAA